jgi:hypothetical protein
MMNMISADLRTYSKPSPRRRTSASSDAHGAASFSLVIGR